VALLTSTAAKATATVMAAKSASNFLSMENSLNMGWNGGNNRLLDEAGHSTNE